MSCSVGAWIDVSFHFVTGEGSLADDPHHGYQCDVFHCL
jgi:hypothetical protein